MGWSEGCRRGDFVHQGSNRDTVHLPADQLRASSCSSLICSLFVMWIPCHKA